MVGLNIATWLLLIPAPMALGDGIGIIGYGKTMYDPPCAFACRSVISGSQLQCTPQHAADTHSGGHSQVKTPKSCFASDKPFMQTLALCIDTYCPGSDAPHMGLIEEFWASHLAAGSIGDFSWVPAMTYQEALQRARADEQSSILASNSTNVQVSQHNQAIKALFGRHHGSGGEEDHDTTPVNTTLPVIKSGAPLNETSFIRRSDWLKNYNGNKSFELNEIGHSKYSIIITVVPFLLAIGASLLRFVPALTRSRSWAWINSIAVYPPLWGTKHRQPTAAALGGGFTPTRGQSLYIFVVVSLNIIFLIAPYHTIQPQSIFPTTREQELSVIGCRAGVMAMGNVVVLTVFAGRNNPLLVLTGWNYDTYLLFHRVCGYLAIFHTVLHSILLLAYYVIFGDYQSELVQPYWIWGIVATVAAVLLWPASVLAIRRRFYEVFLSMHHILVIIFLLGYFYHIFYRYTFNWGYEIWCYIAGGIWGTERLLRLLRMALMGYRTANVTVVAASGGEYLRVDIDGIHARGLVYLYFPTLSWRFWENHPFSVASSFSVVNVNDSSTDAESNKGKGVATDRGRSCERLSADIETKEISGSQDKIGTTLTHPRVSILIRVQAGMTAHLAAKAAAAGTKVRIPAILEGSYCNTSAVQLSQCTSIVRIAGGVGITAVLPILREQTCRRRVFWGVRNPSIVDECNRGILDLPAEVEVETSIGKRLDIRSILSDELLSQTCERGPVGIVVCGPPEMADDVRNNVARLAKSGSLRRGVVLVDEAFSW